MTTSQLHAARGSSLIEVLVTMVIVAFGLLGIAAFQAKAQVGSIESYQRAQAAVLIEDMRSRMRTGSVGEGERQLNGTYTLQSPAYIIARTAAAVTSCGGSGAAFDLCEWGNLLNGTGEQSGAASVGAMVGALGCVEQITAPNPAGGVCTPGVYRVSVAWQGLHETKAPPVKCGQGEFGGNESFRRVLSSRVLIPLAKCEKS